MLKSSDSQLLGGDAGVPAVGNVIAKRTLILKGAFAQGFIPGDGKSFRDLHFAAVVGEHDLLPLGVGINAGEVGGLHSRHRLQHLQQLAHQGFQGLFRSEGLRLPGKNKI